ncbi:hypothetical protein EI94DRAFT_1708497 [Lactarius quietus]|nr:hypothetical protein EI94DRAFT_1708497 [Lactarius quietus]
MGILSQRCKQSLILQIMNKLMKTGQGIDISTAFAWDRIIGYVFLEGTLLAAHNTMKTFVTVFKRPPCLVPLDQRKALLTSQIPHSQSIEEGQWVCCHHRLYRGDIGFVYDIDASRDADVVVILVPRIPMKFTRQCTMKWKKPHHPVPCIWTATQVSSEWGTSVKEESDRKYTFKNITFRSGLMVKQISSEGLKLVGMAPTNIAPFFTAKFLLDHPPFWPWIQWFTQDNIKPYQRVQIDLDECRSLVGYTTYIQDDKATIVARLVTPSSTDGPTQQDGTGTPMKASIHNVEFTTPNSRFYTMHVGTWVNFNKGGDPAEPWRGCVIYVMDTRMTIKEEHTGEEFDLNIHNLNVSSIQGRMLPKTELDYLLVGCWVMVSCGQLKGYIGLIKDVNN